MAIKICTDIEQSERLIKLGLDTNTADMYRWSHNGQWFVSPLSEGGYNFGSNTDKLCWSLSALLKLMPRKAAIYKDEQRYTCEILAVGGDGGIYSNPLDAAFGTVVWLIEHDYIKTKECER